MTLEEILNLEGIIIRKIPKKTIRNWRLHNETLIKHYESKGCRISKDSDGVTLAEDIKENNFGNKYIICFNDSQCSVIRFYWEYCGIGDTIEEAYNDYLLKNKK